jgi:15-cis-phytoene synthase
VAAAADASLAEHGAESIAKGSKSFALASLLFGKETQADVHMLYAWCRHCDDVIDGQTLGGDAPDAALSREDMENRLELLRAQTIMALKGERTGVPAFDGFAQVAARRRIPEAYPMDLLAGFGHDAEGRTYETLDDLMDYCYGVAGVVGVMMAIVMGVEARDDETLDRACDLGLAFQLTNICRDVVDDAAGGRIYLPLDWLARAGVPVTPEALRDPQNRNAIASVVAKVLKEADRYYASASEGARRLPFRAGAAVLAARNVYREIGRKVEALGPAAWDRRTVVSNPMKISLAAAGVAACAGQAALFRARPLSKRENLWKRPVRT